MLVKTLLALQAVDTGMDTRRVLTVNVPVISYGRPMGRSSNVDEKNLTALSKSESAEFDAKSLAYDDVLRKSGRLIAA